MKRTAIGFLLALFLAPGIAAAVPSTIRAVTVYTDRARVTRTAEVAVTPGMNEIAIEVAAFRVDPESVMARVFGDGTLHGVEVREVPRAEAPQEKIEALTARLRDLERARRALTDEKGVLDKQRAFLDAFLDFSRVQVPKELQTRLPDAPTLEATLAFLARGYREADERQRALEVDIETREREIEVARRELAQLRSEAGREVTLIVLLFEASHAQKVRVEADYAVFGASWSPLYKADVPAAADHVELTLMADVRQKTGEDWVGATLSVSTAAPLSGGRLPELDPWVLDFPRPMPRRAMARAEIMKEAAAADAFAAGAGPEPHSEAPLAQAEVHRSALAVTYTLPQPASVASRDKTTLLPVFTRRLEGVFRHLAVPRRQPEVHLVCHSTADRELLAGPMQVYFEGRYLGKTRLEARPAGGDFRLDLGVDRNVRVARAKVVDQRRETFFGRVERDTVAREIAYRISLENRGDRPVMVRLYDQVPVSATDRIRIEDLRLEPAPAVRDDRDRAGVMRWDRRLPPGAEETVEIGFTVIYPKEWTPPPF